MRLSTLTTLGRCAMRDINTLLDRAKATNHLGSDSQLARELNLKARSLYDWRSERRFPTSEQLLNLTECCEQSFCYWSVIIQSRRAKNAILSRRLRAAAEKL